MGIKIYTYSNPYDIKRESFWEEINNCAHFCVSQTMVNGIGEIYPPLKNAGLLTTINILLNSMYSDWVSDNVKVAQMMETDNAINSIDMDDDESGNAKRSLEYNTRSLVKCMRLFKELGLCADSFDVSRMNAEQKYLVEIYRYICKKEKTHFAFNRVTDERTINERMIAALHSKHKDCTYDDMDMSTVVIHGIHQFSPAMLCAIEDIARYKNVILLFNYQKQYKAIYQTWLNIYSLFDKPIIISNENEFKPVSLLMHSYPCNTLADNIGTLSNGQLRVEKGVLDKLEVIEFENITEFAGYCATLFENARKVNSQRKGEKKPILYDMSEQLYSASGKVNDILRAYFPEQFGERHFLDYPIGHFFVSIVEMWDNDEKCVKTDDLSLIKDCLSSGIMSEKRHGQLMNTFNIVESYVEKENTLTGVIKELKTLRKYVSPGDSHLKRIGYLNVTKEELDELRYSLEELNRIIISFFDDFGNGGDNFNRFYQRIHAFIFKKTQDMESLDEEMRNVISRLLDRMSKIDLPETGTFTCLKQTMSYYLSQDDSLVHGANWIVRDFEQIDGDILRSGSGKQKADQTLYHFCCLSDKDICAAKDEKLPWPLDTDFFEYSYEPLERNYQIFLKSKLEFRNFKRYALLYGLEFNRLGCKLSYVKTENRKDNEVYHLIKMLGIKVRKYHSNSGEGYVQFLQYNQGDVRNDPVFSDTDKLRYAVCPYKFALESIVQGGTLYRERFLVIFYLKVMLQNKIHRDHKGERMSIDTFKRIIMDEYRALDDKFHISNEYEKVQIIADMYKYLAGKIQQANKMPDINQTYRRNMDLKEDFLVMDISKEEKVYESIDLAKILAEANGFSEHPSDKCMYCSSKDICLRKMK